MNCDVCRERLMDLLCGILPEAEAAALEVHLAACEGCREARRTLEDREALLRGHFEGLRAEAPIRLPAPRSWRPLAAAAALLACLGVFWSLRPAGERGGIPEAFGDIEVRRKGVTVTVFNTDLALVRDRRQVLNLRPGVNRFRFEEVPGRLQPASIRFLSETDPEGCRVLEQNYEYDLASPRKLLERYVDREVAFERKDPATEGLERLQGTVLSADGLARMGNGEVRGFPGAPLLPALPGGIVTRPALAWVLDAPKERTHDVTVAYLTGGMSWNADYVLVRRGERSFDLDAWVTVSNESGATYVDADLKLLAGDVHRVQEVLGGWDLQEDKAETGHKGADADFEEKAFFEYHLYTLGRATTLRDRESKQMSLFSAADVPCEEAFVCRNGSMLSELVFKNDRASRLGMPLPAGEVRVLAADPDGDLQQVFQFPIEHTPKDEEVRLHLGRPAGLVSERRVLESRSGQGMERETAEIRIRNLRGKPAAVEVQEAEWGEWDVVKSTHAWKRKDAGTASFEVGVPAEGEAVLIYTVERRTS